MLVDGGEIPPMRVYPSRGLPAAELFINDVPRRCDGKSMFVVDGACGR